MSTPENQNPRHNWLADTNPITTPSGELKTPDPIDASGHESRTILRNTIKDFRPVLCVAAGVTLISTIGALMTVDAREEKEMTATEYAQSYDRQNYLLDVFPQSSDSTILPEISEQTFDEIPPYKQGDSLASPRTYNFKLGSEACKTFILPATTYETTARLAVRQGEQYNINSSFGVIYGENTLSICRTNPEKQEKKNSSSTAHMGIAIQLPDYSIEMSGLPIN